MSSLIISLVAALGPQREIGRDNQLLWKIPSDLKRFKQLTLGHTLLMGRKTFESIGRPLPGRKTIVLTRDRHWSPIANPNTTAAKAEGTFVVLHEWDEAIAWAKQQWHASELFVIGGGDIYRQALNLPLAHKMYLTHVPDYAGPADAYFPPFSLEEWKVTNEIFLPQAATDQYSTVYREYLRT
jgi:dihydrofolate reductase